MRKINPEHIRALLDLINRGPYFELLSMKVCELGMGYSRVEVDLERKHLNPFGIIHGGVYSSIKDMQGKLLAHGTSKLMIVQGRQSIQSISQATEAMRYCALPPKFIECE